MTCTNVLEKHCVRILHVWVSGIASGVQKMLSRKSITLVREANSLPYLRQIMKGSTLVIVFLGWICLTCFVNFERRGQKMNQKSLDIQVDACSHVCSSLLCARIAWMACEMVDMMVRCP